VLQGLEHNRDVINDEIIEVKVVDFLGHNAKNDSIVLWRLSPEAMWATELHRGHRESRRR
jgi:hypothetical protein